MERFKGWALGSSFFGKRSALGYSNFRIRWAGNTLVLLDGFQDNFWKFLLFIVKICILIWVFLGVFSKLIACVCWAYAETILSHAEHTRNRFHCTLSIRGTNFRTCSASGKMWAVTTCTIHAEHTLNEFYRTLSIRGTDFIACWAWAEMFKSQISRPNRIRFSKIPCYRPLGSYARQRATQATPHPTASRFGRFYTWRKRNIGTRNAESTRRIETWRKNFFCRNRNHMIPRACNKGFFKILFDSAEIFDF